MHNLSTSSKNSQPTDPAPLTVIQSFATKLRINQAKNETPITISPPEVMTKQGHPTVIFKTEEFMGKLADTCRFTLVGKFTNTMPRMKIIRKSFIAQTQLVGGVKIA